MEKPTPSTLEGAAYDPQHALLEIAKLGPGDGILFARAEPTLCLELPRYIRQARAQGCTVIGLCTNARRLSYLSYAKELLLSGPTHVTVSIHGHTAKIHDVLTRTPGSFLETTTGLRHVLAEKERRTLTVDTSTVVTKRNLKELPHIFHFLAAESVDTIVFNVMQLEGLAVLHARQLVPRYTDVVQAIHTLSSSLTLAEQQRLRLEGLPACLALRLADSVGALETPLVLGPDKPRAVSSYPTLRTLEMRHTTGCQTCRFLARCPGIDPCYLELYGEEEFSTR